MCVCVACASFAANSDGNSAEHNYIRVYARGTFVRVRARLASLVFAHRTAHCVAPHRVFTAAHSSFIIRRHAGVLALLLLLDHSIIPFQAIRQAIGPTRREKPGERADSEGVGYGQ